MINQPRFVSNGASAQIVNAKITNVKTARRKACTFSNRVVVTVKVQLKGLVLKVSRMTSLWRKLHMLEKDPFEAKEVRGAGLSC